MFFTIIYSRTYNIRAVLFGSFPGHQSDAFTLNVSTCAIYEAESDSDIEFYTCSGGTYCDIDTATDEAKVTRMFVEAGVSTEIAINADVEPTTMVISHSDGTDGWYV